jgi:Fic family protein
MSDAVADEENSSQRATIFDPEKPFDLPLIPQLKLLALSKKEAISDALLGARTELAELRGYSMSVHNPMLLISPALLRESIASSSIENIHTTLVDVLQGQLFPEAERREPDKEVIRYRDAIDWARRNVEKYSLSNRLILGVHKHLKVESAGDYRKQQNHIKNASTGETIYTPPVAAAIPGLISDWEKFIHQNEALNPLLKCIIAHYQFEAIHPFGDGNGRTGRILMVVQLIQSGILDFPILYISGYLDRNRTAYYRALREVTAHGSWEAYILFMLSAFRAQALETKTTVFKIMALHERIRHQVKTEHPKVYSADLIEHLFAQPITTPTTLEKALGIHYTTATRHLKELTAAGLLKHRKHGKYQLYYNEKLLTLMKKKA